MDLVEHDGKPLELLEGVDAPLEHALTDDHNLQPTGVQQLLDTLSRKRKTHETQINRSIHHAAEQKPHRTLPHRLSKSTRKRDLRCKFKAKPPMADIRHPTSNIPYPEPWTKKELRTQRVCGLLSPKKRQKRVRFCEPFLQEVV